MDLVRLLNGGALEIQSFGWWIPEADKIEPKVVYTRGGTKVLIHQFEVRAHCRTCDHSYVHPQLRHVTEFVGKALDLKPWSPQIPTLDDINRLRTAMVVQDLRRHCLEHGWYSEEAPPFIILV